MTKKYFDTPRMTLSYMQDVITTSDLNNQVGNGSTGGILAPDPRRKSIWD